MGLSVNTNAGAAIAAQSVNKTGMQLEVTQRRVSTGLAVSGARDNGAIFAIAQGLRSDAAGLDAVQRSLGRGIGMLGAAIAAGEAIQDVLLEMKDLAVAAQDSSLSTGAQTNLDNQFSALNDSLTNIANGANYDGTNLATGASATVLSGASGSTASTTSIGGVTSFIGTLPGADASGGLSNVETALDAVGGALATLGGQLKKLEALSSFQAAAKDALEQGIGALVDADLARESAKLQGLQIKQQLGAQALGIANASPQVVLGFF